MKTYNVEQSLFLDGCWVETLSELTMILAIPRLTDVIARRVNLIHLTHGPAYTCKFEFYRGTLALHAEKVTDETVAGALETAMEELLRAVSDRWAALKPMIGLAAWMAGELQDLRAKIERAAS
jgi:hypothetical protein